MISLPVYADIQYKIRSSDNLNRIVNKYYKEVNLSRSQILVGILAENPDAFRGGNINYLIRGKQLVLPDESNIPVISNEAANDLLAEHLWYFRNGLTAKLKPPFMNASADSKSLENRQLDQNKKIRQLEKESEKLRFRLEQLVAKKKASDKKLREIESALKNPPNQSRSVNHTKQAIEAKKKLNQQIDLKTQSLQQSNRALQKQLQQSRSELAENTRASISLERQISNLQDQAKTADNSELVVNQASVNKENNSGLDINHSVSPLETDDNQSIKTKTLGSLLVLLLAGLGLLLWRWSKQNNPPIIDESDVKQAVAASYLEEGNFIDNIYQEEPLEASVKLEVARAYLKANDTESTLIVLREVMQEGDDEQQQQAQDILSSMNVSDVV